MINDDESSNQKFSDPFAWRLQWTKAENALNNLRKQLTFRGIESTSCILEVCDVNKLNEEVQRNNIDLIMTWKPQEGIDDLLNNVLKTTSVPVIAMPENPSPIKRVLVPLDGSARAECVLPITSLLAQHLECEVILFHVVQPPHGIYQYNQSENEREIIESLVSSGMKKADSYLQNVVKHLPIDSDLEVIVSDKVCSSIHKVINDENIDLIVLSAHGESGQPQWPYGSITNNIITYAQIPVLIVQDLPNTTLDHKTKQVVESLRQPRKSAAAT